MPHIFLNRNNFNGNNNFQTHSAILDITPYEPQVLILGTYNDANIIGNNADFFYGRNYFWPVFQNLANNNNNLLRRRDAGQIPPGLPNLPQILNLCERFRLTFADLISNTQVILQNHSDNHLNAALGAGNAVSNDVNIVNFINNTPSIRFVYITTKLINQINLSFLWNNIINNTRPNVSYHKILTPSGMGGIPNFAELGRTGTIARYWLWVNNIDPVNPHAALAFTNAQGYSHCDHTWLTASGVDVLNF